MSLRKKTVLRDQDETVVLENAAEQAELIAYRDELNRIAHALSTANPDAVANVVDEGTTLDAIESFIDSNTEKRFQLLAKLLEFVEPAFKDFEHLLSHYVVDVPYRALASPSEDADHFLTWLTDHKTLKPKQSDYVACQQARFAVEARARRHRVDHIHFQDLRTLVEQLAPEFGENPELNIRVNPIHVWTRFETNTLLAGAARAPADVIFFAVASGISSAVPSPHAAAVIRQLTDWAPCTREEWFTHRAIADDTVDSPPAALDELCRELAKLGVVAFE